MILAELSTGEIVGALVFAGFMLAERVLGSIASRKNNRQTTQLWHVHLGPNAIDEDGAPKWYVRKALTQATQELSESIQALAEAQRDIAIVLRDLTRETKATARKVEQLAELAGRKGG